MSEPAMRRLTRVLSNPGDNPSVRLLLTTVVTVTAGASLDGVAAVSVTTTGLDSVPAPYLASYATPTVGHFVAVLLINHSPLILGRVIGLPNF